MRCPKCGAGLTGQGKDRFYCPYCNITITVAQANSVSLDHFIKEEDKHDTSEDQHSTRL